MNNNLLVPEIDKYYYINSDTRIMLNNFEKISKKHPVNILVTGKQGCGKSSLVKQFAAVYKRPMATFQVGILAEPGQLFGEHILVGGETQYRPYLFSEAIQTPGSVIHLEEINRPEHPKALNMLFSLLSDDRSVWVDEIGMIKVAEDVIIFATMNEGEEFVGTEMLDPALRDRFYTILLDYIPSEVEIEVLERKSGVEREKVSEIIGIINKIRGHADNPIDVSTRTSLMVAELVAAGASVGEAITYSLQIDKEQLESILLTLHLEKGLLESKKSTKYMIFDNNIE